MSSVTLGFYGGAETVTGANFLFDTGRARFLIDCGLFQGCRMCGDKNTEPFPYDPTLIDVLIITHGHLDHVGRIPRLVRNGFRGEIYSTSGTKDLAELILFDSMGIMEKEARREKTPLLYEKDDVELAMALWKARKYHEKISLPDDFTLRFKDAGHILGSSMAEFSKGKTKMVFTGDLGNSPSPLLHNTEEINDAQYILMETVYGDRNHEGKEERKKILQNVIIDTINRGGALMIPAFSIERTQVLLSEVNEMVEHKKIPPVPIFLDSPLAIKATAVYDKYERYFNKKTMDIIKSGDDIFNFLGLVSTLKTEESKNINNIPNPKVIIAGSGMSEGGRIIHHEKRYLPDSKSTLLLIGYQAPGTMGRAILEGAKEVKILGEKVSVKAKIVNLRGYSAHKDSDGLLEFVSNDIPRLKKLFLGMGEPKSAMYFAQRVHDNFDGVETIIPKMGEKLEIEWV